MTTELTTVPQITPAVPAKAFPITAQYTANLEAFLARPLDNARLLSAPVLESIRTELASAPTGQTSEPDAARIALMLTASYPQKDGRDSQEAQAYLMALTDELQRFPPEVAREAARHVRRTLEFRPTPADVVKAAEAIQEHRRSLLIAVERQEREHQRHASRASQEAIQAAEIDADTIDLHIGLRNAFGPLAIDASDFPDAQRGMQFAGNLAGDFQRRGAVTWLKAYRAAEAWAVVAARRASLFGRALRQHQAEVLDMAGLCAVVGYLARNNEAAAMHLIERAETGDLLYIDRPTADWSTLRKLIVQAIDRNVCEAVALVRNDGEGGAGQLGSETSPQALEG
ncbi:hypothetical protein [Azospirillum argentinense]|nr:hypothetical protein [Azospirillum argentinense]